MTGLPNLSRLVGEATCRALEGGVSMERESLAAAAPRQYHPDTFGDEGGFECPDFQPHPDDPETSCTFGGMGCQYWLRDPDCSHPHWERHYVGADGTCACGTEYPGASKCVVEFDATAVEGCEPRS